MDASAYQAATEMYKLEYARWNQNSLLFLGVIAALFVPIQYLKEIVPLWAVSFLAAVVSFLWLCSVLSMRGTSYAWDKTLQYLEANPDCSAPFTYCAQRRREFGLWKDLLANFRIRPQHGTTERRFLLFTTVTRLYQALALALIVTFSTFGLWIMLRETNLSQARALTLLGEALIEREVTADYPDARIVGALGPITSRKDGQVIQVEIARQSGERCFLNWHFDRKRSIVTGPDSCP